MTPGHELKAVQMVLIDTRLLMSVLRFLMMAELFAIHHSGCPKNSTISVRAFLIKHSEDLGLVIVRRYHIFIIDIPHELFVVTFELINEGSQVLDLIHIDVYLALQRVVIDSKFIIVESGSLYAQFGSLKVVPQIV